MLKSAQSSVIAPVLISWEKPQPGLGKTVPVSEPGCPQSLRGALAFGPTPLGFIFSNLFGGGVFLGFEGLHFEYISLIDGSMV